MPINRSFIFAVPVLMLMFSQVAIAQCQNGNCANHSYQSFPQQYQANQHYYSGPTYEHIVSPQHIVSTSRVAVENQEFSGNSARIDMSNVAYDGYCSVCIVNARKWVKGSPEFSSTFDGKSYWFPSASEKNIFDATPTRFVPALNGDCIVCLANHGKRVPGKVEHSALFRERIYLFPSDAEKKMFVENVANYANADLAVNGNCIVCQVKAGKQVRGSEDFQAFHNGIRYLFPSDAERRTFIANPQSFVSDNSSPPSGTQGAVTTNAAATVNVVGQAGCAACEFGKHPVGAPDQLGLAVKSQDGNVYIVEDAHVRQPQIYADRFQGGQLTVSGTVLRREGKFVWLTPQSIATNR